MMAVGAGSVVSLEGKKITLSIALVQCCQKKKKNPKKLFINHLQFNPNQAN